MRRNRDSQSGSPNPMDRSGEMNDPAAEFVAEDPLAYETVIVPARLASAVARRVAIASNRDGVSIADLLGRAAAAFDWGEDDDAGPRPVDPRQGFRP